MKEDFYEKGVDLKLLLLLYWKRLWICLVWTVFGALICTGIYYMAHVVYAPAREYEAVSKLYLTFNKKDDGEAYQHYNGYTWNDLMGTEPIMNKILEELSGYDGILYEDDIRESITADILSDIRLLTITVRTKDSNKTDAIIKASEAALVSFGSEMEEFERIDIIQHGIARMVKADDNTKRAGAAGAVIGFVASILFIAIMLVMEDYIYVPLDVERYLGISVLGVVYKKEPERDMERLKSNIGALGSISPVYVMAGLKDSMKQEDKEGQGIERIITPNMAQQGMDVILAIPYAYATVRMIKRDISDLKIRGCGIKGAIITGADDKLYKRYFFK